MCIGSLSGWGVNVLRVGVSHGCRVWGATCGHTRRSVDFSVISIRWSKQVANAGNRIGSL